MGGSRGHSSHTGRDAIELCPNDEQLLPRLLIPEGLTIDFGREAYPSIQQSYISRHHCQLYWKSDPLLRVTAGKRTMAIATDDKVTQVEPGGLSGEVRSPFKHCQVVTHSRIMSFFFGADAQR